MAFSNKRFLADIVRGVGNVRIRIRSATPECDNHRQLAATIYDLAAELERRSDDLGARWVVSPAPFDRRIDVELVKGEDVDAAARVVMDVLAGQGLA